MAEEKRRNHHHHHHKMDGASRFKKQSLNAIERRKIILKYSFRALIAIAIIMFLAVLAAYLLD